MSQKKLSENDYLAILEEIIDQYRVPLYSKHTVTFMERGCWPRERVLRVAKEAYALGKLAPSDPRP